MSFLTQSSQKLISRVWSSTICKSRFATKHTRFLSFQASKVVYERKYTTHHDWIDLEEQQGIATIGYSKYNMERHDEVVFVKFVSPSPPALIKAQDQIIYLECTKIFVDILTPVTGTLLELNKNLQENPSLLHSSPETDGWFCKIKMTPEDQSKELKDLMDKDQYQKYVDEIKGKEQAELEKWAKEGGYVKGPDGAYRKTTNATQ